MLDLQTVEKFHQQTRKVDERTGPTCVERIEFLERTHGRVPVPVLPFVAALSLIERIVARRVFEGILILALLL